MTFLELRLQCLAALSVTAITMTPARMARAMEAAEKAISVEFSDAAYAIVEPKNPLILLAGETDAERAERAEAEHRRRVSERRWTGLRLDHEHQVANLPPWK